MKRTLLIVVVVILAVAGFNLFFFTHLKKVQLNYQKEVLLKQTMLCGEHLENIISDYENDLNRIIFRNLNTISTIFSDRKQMHSVTRELESFYAKYRELITNISVYDNKDKYLGVYINQGDEFVIDTFSRQISNDLQPRDIILERSGHYLSHFPYFDNNELRGNIVVEINLDKYVNDVFRLYQIEGIQWQWILSTDGAVIYSNYKGKIEYTGLEQMADSIMEEREGMFESFYLIDGEKSRIISAYYPLNVLRNDLGIVFSSNTTRFTDIFKRNAVFYLILSGLVLLILIYYLLLEIRKLRSRIKDLDMEIVKLGMMMEQFPIGIMITDNRGIIRTLNRTGQKILFVGKDEDIIGKNIEEQFTVSNKYLLKEGLHSLFDSNHFLHYVKEGNEVVIFRADNKAYITGEEFTISALIDVSSLEKARKQEAAAHHAKSEFIAKMSHEIRTPMNGIMVMTDQLLKGKLSEEQKEKTLIIKKSCELLLNVMNDVLDFSKIEAGKMMLEEIPFNLDAEIALCIDLFRPLATQKKLGLFVNIKPDVPRALTGDPFRIRQVLNNLLSNAVKFTVEGKINLNVHLAERSGNLISLMFCVEDTGVGISKEQLGGIFGNYEQARGNDSRKYGGTGLGTSIAKQLVEMMNGEIWVESPSEISDNPKYPGTRFCFTIELHSDEKIQKSFDFSGFTSFHQLTALILSKVKDETDHVHKILDSFGINYIYRIYEDKTIDATLYHIEQKADLYQLIILKDKPENSAFGMARQLFESRLADRFPVIMISSADKAGNYLNARNLGVDRYLIQPYESNEIFGFLSEFFPGISDQKSMATLIHKIPENLKILVAEDNLISQRVIQAIFKHLGYEIELAQNGLQAFEKAKTGHFDIVFMDLIMPEMDGVTAARKIRAEGIDIPLIALTASDDPYKKEESEQAGMSDFIPKPLKAETVKSLLIKWFSKSGAEELID